MIYAIEIAGTNNESLFFFPLGETLRGRWETAKTARFDKNDVGKAFAEIPVIPGIHVTVDTEKKHIVVADPLETTESGRQILANINKIAEGYPNNSVAKRSGPFPKREIKNASPDQIKEFCHWMVRAVETNMAVSLDLPGVQKVNTENASMHLENIAKMTGKRRRDPGADTNYNNADAPPRFVDEIESRAMAESK